MFIYVTLTLKEVGFQMSFSKRISILRNLETECYQICFYLLNNEKIAVQSAAQTLYSLFNHTVFFDMNTRDQKSHLRQTAIKFSLKMYKNHIETKSASSLQEI